jgi:hypothetical protein
MGPARHGSRRHAASLAPNRKRRRDLRVARSSWRSRTAEKDTVCRCCPLGKTIQHVIEARRRLKEDGGHKLAFPVHRTLADMRSLSVLALLSLSLSLPFSASSSHPQPRSPRLPGLPVLFPPSPFPHLPLRHTSPQETRLLRPDPTPGRVPAGGPRPGRRTRRVPVGARPAETSSAAAGRDPT